MKNLLNDIASFMLEHPELKDKKNYEIYNIWFSKNKYKFTNMQCVKLVLEYINDLKKLPRELLMDCMERGAI